MKTCEQILEKAPQYNAVFELPKNQQNSYVKAKNGLQLCSL